LDLDNPQISKLGKSLLEKFCTLKPSHRYTALEALKHPWITRDKDAEIPRNSIEQGILLMDSDAKLRKAVFTSFFLSATKINNSRNPQNDSISVNMSSSTVSMSFDEYKTRIQT
jgi:serine/threonine protein kinase